MFEIDLEVWGLHVIIAAIEEPTVIVSILPLKLAGARAACTGMQQSREMTAYDLQGLHRRILATAAAAA